MCRKYDHSVYMLKIEKAFNLHKCAEKKYRQLSSISSVFGDLLGDLKGTLPRY